MLTSSMDCSRSVLQVRDESVAVTDAAFDTKVTTAVLHNRNSQTYITGLHHPLYEFCAEIGMHPEAGNWSWFDISWLA